MANRVPKYALIGGREASLLEVVTHAVSHELACIYEDDAGNRRYALKSEWDVGVEKFARFAADRRLVTSESPGREKIALFKSLFKGREDAYAHGFAKKMAALAIRRHARMRERAVALVGLDRIEGRNVPTVL